MRDKRPALILYVSSISLVLIAKVFDFENLLLIAKSVVVPSIFYYYLQTRRDKVNILFSIALVFFFIADMILVVYPNSAIVAVMLCGVVSYLILIRFAVRDSHHINSKPIYILTITALLVLLGVVLLPIINLSILEIAENYKIYLLYGIILWVFLSISIYNYISIANNAFLYLCIAAVCLFLSDVFYCVNVYMVELPVISILNLLTQLLSYFFIVRYFNLRKKIARQKLQ